MRKKISITKTYKSIYALPIGMGVISNQLNAGPVNVYIGKNGLPYRGTLSKNGIVSGLSKLFHDMKLEIGTSIYFENHALNSIKLYLNEQSLENEPIVNSVPTSSPSTHMRWFHHEILELDNLKRWKPKTTPDVAILFNLLIHKTKYKFCNIINKEVLTKIGYFEYNPTINSIPSAILNDPKTNHYLLADFYIYSSSYKHANNPSDMDVLIVWKDDELKRSHLPNIVIELCSLV